MFSLFITVMVLLHSWAPCEEGLGAARGLQLKQYAGFILLSKRSLNQRGKPHEHGLSAGQVLIVSGRPYTQERGRQDRWGAATPPSSRGPTNKPLVPLGRGRPGQKWSKPRGVTIKGMRYGEECVGWLARTNMKTGFLILGFLHRCVQGRGTALSSWESGERINLV